jgi:hypothetical protein
MVVKKPKTKTKTKKRNKKTRVNKYTSCKTRTRTRSRTRSISRKIGDKYKIYSGGLTPRTSPLGTPFGYASPSTGPITPINYITPPIEPEMVRTSPLLNEAAQNLENYAYNRESPYYSPGKQVVPVTQLPGRGRTPSLTYEQQIHSTGDRFSDRSIEQIIKSPLKRKSVAPSISKLASVSAYGYAPSRRTKTARPPMPPTFPTPPTPPQAVLTSSGNLKTTYTPSMDVVDMRMDPLMSKTGVEIPRYLMLPFRNAPPVTLALSYMPMRGNMFETLTPAERTMLDTINQFNEDYSYLSPQIYDTLQKLNRTDHFGTLLVWGRLRDELKENIRISSMKAIQSRTLFSEYNTRRFLTNIMLVFLNRLVDTGPSPSMPNKQYPNELVRFNIPPPKHPPGPTSLQIVGYNTHPMYNTYLTRDVLTELSGLSADTERAKEKKKKEKIFILAHGAVADELPSELKLLANKYLRVIELGKKHTLLSVKYPSVFLRINNILFDPDNVVMFENTDEGAKKRKEIFDIICKYIYINRLDACIDKDTLSLTDITHDRKFEGEFIDRDIQEDHNITMNTLRSFYSMGIFKPVDYRKGRNDLALYNKKIFELYPGTTFVTKNTSFLMVRTLLPIAIRENKIMNILIFSCAPEYYTNVPFVPPTDPLYIKPSEVTPAMKLLIEGKRFIFNTSRMISSFVTKFFGDGFFKLRQIQVGNTHVYQRTIDYFETGKPAKFEAIDIIDKNLENFYNQFFSLFLRENSGFNYNAAFSFAGIGAANASFDLIEDGNPIANEPYANELIKVKIYLMEELYRMFHKIMSYYIVATSHLLEIFTKLITLYNDATLGHKIMRESITQKITMARFINEFFLNLRIVMMYITNGFYGNDSIQPPVSPIFLRYPKYIEVKREYDESNVRSIYDEINEGQDYDRYELMNPDAISLMPSSRGQGVRGLIKNYMPPEQFRLTARNTYQYKEFPNIDAVKKRRKTMKAKVFDDDRVKHIARKTRPEDNYQISI